MNDQNAINPNQRTMAYNSLSNHLYVISRNSNIGSNYNIYVLNPTNGTLLYTLRTNGIFNAGAVGSAGIGLDGIGVADDGAIYACNMAPNASGSNGLDATSLFRVYRWANGNSNTTPVTVFTGDPSGTNGVLRWGDNLTVRGSGTNTQILVDSNTRLASNSVRYAAVLSPVNQGLTNFTAKWFITTNSGTAIGKSLEFDGANNNLWQKASLSALVKSSFDPTTLVGSNQIAASTLAVYNGFSVRVCGVGLDQTRGLAAGVEIPVPSVPDTLDLYSITNLNAPVLLSQVAFPTSPHNVNTSFISQTFFAGDKLFTLDANNGIMVFSVAPLSYNVVVPAGQKLLIANQLDHGNNTLDEVLPSVPDGTQLQKYNCDGSYTTYTRSAGAWNPAGATLMPGEGAFLVNNSGAALTNTFTGIPHTPVLPPNLPCGCGNYNLLSCQTNTMGTWENIMGFPPGDGAVSRGEPHDVFPSAHRVGLAREQVIVSATTGQIRRQDRSMRYAGESISEGRAAIVHEECPLTGHQSCTGRIPGSCASGVGGVAAVAVVFLKLCPVGDAGQDFVQRVVAVVELVGDEKLLAGRNHDVVTERRDREDHDAVVGVESEELVAGEKGLADEAGIDVVRAGGEGDLAQQDRGIEVGDAVQIKGVGNGRDGDLDARSQAARLIQADTANTDAESVIDGQGRGGDLIRAHERGWVETTFNQSAKRSFLPKIVVGAVKLEALADSGAGVGGDEPLGGKVGQALVHWGKNRGVTDAVRCEAGVGIHEDLSIGAAAADGEIVAPAQHAVCSRGIAGKDGNRGGIG